MATVRFQGGPWDGIEKEIPLAVCRKLRINVQAETLSPFLKWTDPIGPPFPKPVPIVTYEIRRHVSGEWFGVVVGE